MKDDDSTSLVSTTDLTDYYMLSGVDDDDGEERGNDNDKWMIMNLMRDDNDDPGRLQGTAMGRDNDGGDGQRRGCG